MRRKRRTRLQRRRRRRTVLGAIFRWSLGLPLGLFSLAMLVAMVVLMCQGNLEEIVVAPFGLGGLYLAYGIINWVKINPPEETAASVRAERAESIRLHGRRRFEPTHVALYSILGGMAAFLLFCGLMNYFVWAPSGKVWGTYTVTGHVCSARNAGGEDCHAAGTWTSDDGKQTLDDVGLLKSLPPGTVVRAYAQPHTPWATNTVSEAGDDSGMYWKLAGAIGVCLIILTVSYIHWNPLPPEDDDGADTGNQPTNALDET